jgi:phosphoglycerate kinase
MAKLTVRDLDVRGKRVFVRVDYNVPLEEKDGQMVITDATRIVETIPTLQLLIEKGGKVILAAHLGRPKGKSEPSMSLRPIAMKLADLLGRSVAFVDDCIGEKVEKTVGVMQPGDVLLLENVRYYSEEEANNPAFAEKLAKVADVYVNDAFGAAHRAHASTEGIARVVAKRGGQCAAGLLMERELKFLGEELENPARPFAVILGGAKVSDKIQVIDRLLEKADTLLIDYQDVRVNTSLDCPDDAAGLDIGPQTVKVYSEEVSKAKTILWNGPMGLFEDKRFTEGTNAVACAIADVTQKNGAKSIIGGGDSVKALNKARLGDKVTFMSTGGGASLEFLEGKVLPGVAALSEKKS